MTIETVKPEPTADEITGHDIEFLAEMRGVLTAGSTAFQHLDMIIAKLETERSHAAILAMDRRAEVVDEGDVEQAITDSLGMDWTPHDGAHAVMRLLRRASPPAPAVAVPEGLLKEVHFWLEGALTCKAWEWDGDQRGLAEDALKQLGATLAAAPTPPAADRIAELERSIEEDGVQIADLVTKLERAEAAIAILSEPTPPAAEAPGQEPVADTLRSVIARLESACELLASTRPQAAYIAMIDGGQADALLALDEARQEARTVLSATPTYADAEAMLRAEAQRLEADGDNYKRGAARLNEFSKAAGMRDAARFLRSLASPAPKEGQ